MDVAGEAAAAAMEAAERVAGDCRLGYADGQRGSACIHVRVR